MEIFWLQMDYATLLILNASNSAEIVTSQCFAA